MNEPEQRDFWEDTAAEHRGDGVWGARIDDGWSGPPGPNGGYVAALILRAIRAEVGDPSRTPRSFTIHYLRPPAVGEVELIVTVERSGRSATFCSARMLQGGKTTCTAQCVLSYDFESVGAWQDERPEVDPPEQIDLVPAGTLPPNIFWQLEMHTAFGGVPFQEREPAVVGGWLRTRKSGPMQHELVAMYTDCWWPAPFERTSEAFLAPTLDLTIHFRDELPPDHEHVLGRFTNRTLARGFFEEDGELWSRDGRLIAQCRQLAIARPWKS